MRDLEFVEPQITKWRDALQPGDVQNDIPTSDTCKRADVTSTGCRYAIAPMRWHACSSRDATALNGHHNVRPNGSVRGSTRGSLNACESNYVVASRVIENGRSRRCKNSTVKGSREIRWTVCTCDEGERGSRHSRERSLHLSKNKLAL